MTKKTLTTEDIESEIKDFRQFAFKSNMFEMAVAFIIGNAFNKLVTSISEYLIMPIVNLMLSHAGGHWREIVWQPTNFLTFEIGKVISSFVDLFFTALILYILYVKGVKKLAEELERKEKDLLPYIKTNKETRSEDVEQP